MERLASLESEEAFNGLNDTEATIHEETCQSNLEKVSLSETSHTLIDDVTPVFDNNKNPKLQNSTDIIDDQNISATLLPDRDEIVEESIENSVNPSSVEKVHVDDPPFIPELKEEETIEDSIEAAIDKVSPPFVPAPVEDSSIEDSIDTYLDEKTTSVITAPTVIPKPTQEEGIEDSIEAFISSSERRGSIHDAPEVNKFIDQEKTEDTSSQIHSSKSQNVTDSVNAFEKEKVVPSNPFEEDDEVKPSNPFDDDQKDEESGKNPFDDEPIHDEIKEENSSPPRPIRALAPASQAEDLLSRLKDATEVDVSSIKSENFSNTSSDQAIDIRPSSSANDADSSDGDLERLAVKIDESGNVMDESDGESSIEMVDENEKQKRAEMMKQEDLIHKQNEEKFMMILQQLTEREAQILDEQDEVDDRAKVVETDLRLAMKQDQRKEAELTGEWLALVQKRDDLLKSGSLIGLQRKRAKLELEYLDVQRQCRVLSLKHEYEKTEEDRNSEEALIQKCVQLVQDKAIIEEEMGELEQEIDDQRERHAVQMQKNLMEQEKLKQAENSTSIFGIKRSWFS